jgi:Pro-kumamolisin, activation domain/Putative Ig domain/Subtilase family
VRSVSLLPLRQLHRSGARPVAVLLALVAASAHFATPAAAETADSATAQAPATVRIGTAPAIPAAAQPSGAVAAETTLHLEVGLEPRDPAGLEEFADAVSTPGSAEFRQYLGSGEFASLFAPTEAQVAKVRGSLEAAGLEVGPAPADRMILPVSGTATTVEAAFATPLREVELPSGRLAYANLRAPAVAAAAAPYVAGVAGLDDLRELEPQALESHVVTGGPQPCSEAHSFGWTADQIANAYGFSSFYGTGNLGQGQTIALVELEPFAPSDIAAYQACYKTNAAVTTVNVAGGLNTTKSEGEATLDIEQVIGLAPQANVRVYQGPNNGAAGVLAILSAITSEDVAKSISTSWGLCELPSERSAYLLENNLLEEAAAQGQSFFSAAGDDGSEDCYRFNKSTGLSVDNPSSQPFATGVGGTTLTSAAEHRETLWNEGAKRGAGGGGVSSIWPMPSYQSSAAPGLGVVNADSGSACGVSLCREVPDVSADAAPSSGYPIYDDGGWQTFGGTSAAAPLWAAFAALADASPGCAARPVGFVNPALYALGSSAYPTNLRDVTAASPSGFATNDFLFAGTQPYPATAGYDMATGLGTPIGGALAASLCGLAGPAFSVSVSYPGPQQGTVGSPVALQISAAQSAGREMSFAATGLPAGLTINPTTGLISGTPTAVVSTTVGVTVADPFGDVSSTQFTWSIATNEKVVRARLTGLAHGRPKLTFKVEANVGQELRSLQAKVPAGLRLNRLARLVDKRVKVLNAKKKALKAKATPIANGLRVRFAKPTRGATIVVPYPALVAEPKLIKLARRHKLGTMRLALKVVETAGAPRLVSAPLEPR